MHRSEESFAAFPLGVDFSLAFGYNENILNAIKNPLRFRLIQMKNEKRTNVRNIAIIAHVDHGKTTLVDKMLRFAGTLDVAQGDACYGY